MGILERQGTLGINEKINILKYIPENPNSGYYDTDVEPDGNTEPFGSYMELKKMPMYIKISN